MSACEPSSPDTPPRDNTTTNNTTTNNTTINNTNHVDHQNINLINSPERVQAPAAPPPAASPPVLPPNLTPPDGDKTLYCERLRYEELKLVNQAKDVRHRALANPLKREPRQHLFTQHEQMKTHLRNVQRAMSTQCNLAPEFFDFPSEQELKKQLIELSIKEYPSKCPCPYSGSNCGGRSAWSRAGGYEPYCYVTDIQ